MYANWHNLKERVKNDHKTQEKFFRNVFNSLTSQNVSDTLSKSCKKGCKLCLRLPDHHFGMQGIKDWKCQVSLKAATYLNIGETEGRNEYKGVIKDKISIQTGKTAGY